MALTSDRVPLVVLIAEQPEDARELLVAMLQTAGYLVRGVGTVAEAKVVLTDLRLDVLVTGSTLPDGAAPDVLRLCAGAAPAVRILLSDDAGEAGAGDLRGFQVALQKPVVAQALFDAIREHAGTSSSRPSSP